jgi:predicted RNA binding protein YcfA (HicA-like mRNA interferase family)
VDPRKSLHHAEEDCRPIGLIIRQLEKDGWFLVRTRGSHRQYHHASKPGTVTVAGHPGQDLHPKTLNSILKQAGLK